VKKNGTCSCFVKRSLIILFGSLGLLSGCKVLSKGDADVTSNGSNHSHVQDRFFGTGGAGELVLDAIGLKRGVTFYNERGSVIGAHASLSPKNNSKSAYPGGERGVPKTVRATWRTGNFEQKAGSRGWDGGTIIGDYAIPVADRIPDEVLDYIRKNGGALRIKLRLKDDGILLGWDVQRRVPIPDANGMPCTRTRRCEYGLVFEMPGGDFLDTNY
jgi:hypothetical protein